MADAATCRERLSLMIDVIVSGERATGKTRTKSHCGKTERAAGCPAARV